MAAIDAERSVAVQALNATLPKTELNHSGKLSLMLYRVGVRVGSALAAALHSLTAHNE